MTAVTYPTAINTEDGWGLIFKGHNLTIAAILAELDPEPTQLPPRVIETNLAYTPRIKRCSALDGWGCDQEGEWHAHWFEVKPGDDTAFTIVHQRFPRPTR